MRGLAGDLPGERLDRPRRARSSRCTSIPRSPCARRRTPRSSWRPTSSATGEADAVVTAGHTGAAMAAAVLRLGRLPGVDRPGARRPDDHGPRPDGAPRHRRQPRLDAGEPRPVRPDGRDLRRARPRRRRAARRAALDRRGEGQGRRRGSSAPRSCSTPRTSASSATSRARTWSAHRPTSSSATPSLGNVVIKFFEGLSGFIFDLLRAEFRRRLAGPARLPAPAAGHRADPEGLRLREGRRLAAARRARDGHHHPRPGEAADDRATPSRSRRRRPGPASRS